MDRPYWEFGIEHIFGIGNNILNRFWMRVVTIFTTFDQKKTMTSSSNFDNDVRFEDFYGIQVLKGHKKRKKAYSHLALIHSAVAILGKTRGRVEEIRHSTKTLLIQLTHNAKI